MSSFTPAVCDKHHDQINVERKELSSAYISGKHSPLQELEERAEDRNIRAGTEPEIVNIVLRPPMSIKNQKDISHTCPHDNQMGKIVAPFFKSN